MLANLQAASSLGLLRSLPLQNQPLPLIATFALTAGVAICLGPLIIFHTVLLTLGMVRLPALAINFHHLTRF